MDLDQIKALAASGESHTLEFKASTGKLKSAFETICALSDADAFLRRHLPIASFFKSDQFKRIDKPALPVMAVREALINAICHRNYTDRSTDIALAVYDDCLELWNSGSLPKKITVENLKYKHQLENPPALRTVGDDLAYLKELKLVEVKGRAKWFLIQK